MKKPHLKESYARLLKVSDDHKQITLPDSRYYRRNGEYYPSITYILSSFPKGKHYEVWLKQHGYSSDYIAKKSAGEGTMTHELIEDYLNGEEISFLDRNGEPKYPIIVWKMFLNFINFWEEFKPKLIEVEVHLFSDKYKIAGTCDLICEIDGELWIIDFKTSNHVHETYHLQSACYATCYEECFGKKPTRRGILWLKSKSRGPDKNNKKIKGKNWELVESPRTFEEDMELFECTKKLFEITNPKHKPFEDQFITTAKRED